MSLTDRLIDMERRPPEPEAAAFSNLRTREVDDAWLAQADHGEQAKAMRLWFLARYCDPQVETPYNSDAGCYFYLRGGPYYPMDVLMERFEGISDFNTIEVLGREFLTEIGAEWAPTALTAVDERDEVFIDTPEGPRRRLGERLGELRTLAELDGLPKLRVLLRQLAYAAVITALETYLWELAAFWIEKDDTAFERIADHDSGARKKLVEFGGDSRETRAKLKQILQKHGLKSRVWHRWKDNSRFLCLLFDVQMPSHEALQDPTRIRHDIAHRGGKSADHTPVNLSAEDVEQLMTVLTIYADSLQAAIDARGLVVG